MEAIGKVETKWLNLRVPFWWKRRYKKFCAMKGVYMSDYTKVAIEEKMEQDPEAEKIMALIGKEKG